MTVSTALILWTASFVNLEDPSEIEGMCWSAVTKLLYTALSSLVVPATVSVASSARRVANCCEMPVQIAAEIASSSAPD
jgi:hypothetical protein